MPKLNGPFSLVSGYMLVDAGGIVIGTIGSGAMAQLVLNALNEWWADRLERDEEDEVTDYANFPPTG